MDARSTEQTPEPEIYVLAAWKLPLIVASIVCAIVGGFYLGGAGLGLFVGALAASSVLIMAIVHPPRPAIVPCAVADRRDRLLVVVHDPEAEAILTAAALAAAECEGALEILILVPMAKTFVERWSEDVGPAERRARRRIANALAVLRRAGADGSARIGDEDPVQAVIDTVAEYPATRVTLVGSSARTEKAAADLAARLTVPFMHLRGTGAGAPAVAGAGMSEALGLDLSPARHRSN